MDVAIIVGSENDLNLVQESGMLGILDRCGVGWELSIISAHRHPKVLSLYCSEAIKRRVKVFIGIAGMAAHLAGAIAANIEYHLPVIGVPLPSAEFPNTLDALLSMVRMPSGCPVAVPGIGKAGLKNATILACQTLSLVDEEIKNKLAVYLKNEGQIKSPQIRVKGGIK